MKNLFKLIDDIDLRIVLFLVIANILAIEVWLTLQNQIYGIDSWFWARVAGFPIPLVNFTVSVFVFVVSRMFLVGANRKHATGKLMSRHPPNVTPYVLAIVFLTSTFTIRFLEFELDDYLFFMMFAVLVFAFPRRSVVLGLLGMVALMLVHSFFGFPFYTQSEFLENNIDYTKVVHLIPVFYLLAVNRRWKFLFCVSVLFMVFPIPKFVGTMLPIFIFGILYSMRNERLRFDRIFLLMFVVSSAIFYWSASSVFVNDNLAGLENLCDESAMTCVNSEPDEWWLGHYFRYLGYAPTNYPAGGVGNVTPPSPILSSSTPSPSGRFS